MANERRSIRKSMESRKENGIVLHFNKNCEVGKVINEHLLPDNFQETTLTNVFLTCVEFLLCANIDSYKFSTALTRNFGVYGDVIVKSRMQLRQLLRKLCSACGACENFIGLEKNEKCCLCDEDEDDDDEPVIKKVTSFASLPLLFQIFTSEAIFFSSCRQRKLPQ